MPDPEGGGLYERSSVCLSVAQYAISANNGSCLGSGDQPDFRRKLVAAANLATAKLSTTL